MVFWSCCEHCGDTLHPLMLVVDVVAFQVYALFRTYSPFFCEIAARRMSVVCVDGVVCQLITRAIREYFITSFMYWTGVPAHDTVIQIVQ